MGKIVPLSIRFFDKILITDFCWEWIGAKYKDGYGALYKNSKLCRAHRISYELFVDEIPDGMLVCHHCDNPACVKPEHLFIGTIKDNVKDKCNKGRASGGSLKGESCPSHKYTEEIVLMIRQLYDEGGISKRGLAKKLNIPHSTVIRIINKDTWKHI